jgi:hypothetical protein
VLVISAAGLHAVLGSAINVKVSQPQGEESGQGSSLDVHGTKLSSWRKRNFAPERRGKVSETLQHFGNTPEVCRNGVPPPRLSAGPPGFYQGPYGSGIARGHLLFAL